MSLHNRLTHSLKVEQVGVSIYSKLQAEDPTLRDRADVDAIAAACLAHDIGHPPFGHAGEQELNALLVCKDHRRESRPYGIRVKDPCIQCALEDGFEGNAQSFRVIAVLAVHRDSASLPRGLDLTRASLVAASKYPWTRGAAGRKETKWGAYDCDRSILEWAVGAGESDPSLDAQIMDWADDISYAEHDIEDFFRVGQIPMDDYKPDTDSLKRFLEYVESPGSLGPLTDDVRAALTGLLEFFPQSRFGGQSADLATLDRLRGILLSKFIDAATVDGSQLGREPVQEGLNAVLKQLIWYHIIDDPILSNIQAGQRRVLRDIFEWLRDLAEGAYHSGQATPASERELRRLPQPLRRAIELGMQQDSHYTQKQKICRGVVDYIAGLSDGEAYGLHAVLRGREQAGHL